MVETTQGLFWIRETFQAKGPVWPVTSCVSGPAWSLAAALPFRAPDVKERPQWAGRAPSPHLSGRQLLLGQDKREGQEGKKGNTKSLGSRPFQNLKVWSVFNANALAPSMALSQHLLCQGGNPRGDVRGTWGSLMGGWASPAAVCAVLLPRSQEKWRGGHLCQRQWGPSPWLAWLLSVSSLQVIFFFKILFNRERGREGEGEGENRCVKEAFIVCLSYLPTHPRNQGPGPQPRNVPWLGMEPPVCRLAVNPRSHASQGKNFLKHWMWRNNRVLCWLFFICSHPLRWPHRRLYPVSPSLWPHPTWSTSRSSRGRNKAWGISFPAPSLPICILPHLVCISNPLLQLLSGSPFPSPALTRLW